MPTKPHITFRNTCWRVYTPRGSIIIFNTFAALRAKWITHVHERPRHTFRPYIDLSDVLPNDLNDLHLTRMEDRP